MPFMKNLTITTLFFWWLAIPAVTAQKSIGIMKQPGMPQAGLQQKTVDTLLRAAEKTFFAYQAACSLADPKAGKVTAGSIDKFLNLFEFNANVVQDFLMDDPRPDIKSPDYATLVYKYIPQGLKVEFISAVFTNINYDSLGFYRVYARMEKVVKTGLTKDLKPLVLEDSCVHTQFFTFYVEKNEMDKAKIFRIQNGGKIRCVSPGNSKPLSFFGAVNLGTGFGKTQANDYWPSGTTDASVDFNAAAVNVKGFSGGVQYRLKQSKVSLCFGLQYNWFSTKVGLDTIRFKVEQEVEDTLDPGKTKFLRGISLHQFEESGTISVAQALIGINYRMMESKRFNFGIDLLLMPGRVMQYKNEQQSEVKYFSNYTYKGVKVFEVVISEQLPNTGYLTGVRQYKSESSLPYEKGIFLAAQIAPVFEYNLTSHIGFRLSGYCQVPLTSWFKTSEKPYVTPFLYAQNDIKYSVLSEYVKQYKVTHFGLQAGLRYRL